MRLRHHVSTLFALAGGLGLLSGAHGQAASPTETVPAAVKPDIALLNKTIAAIEANKTLDSTSDMQMTATGQGMTVAFHEHVHFQLQKPGQYHADITLIQPDGTPGEKYTVVSNGVRVWVSQPSTGQYAVMPRAAFQANDLAGLGLFGSLVADSVGNQTGGLLDLKGLTKSGVKIGGGTESSDGVDYRVFSMRDPKQGYNLRFLLSPEAMVHQLALNGQQKGLTFSLTETITRQSAPASLPPALFHFTPAAGAKRVPKLPIGPF